MVGELAEVVAREVRRRHGDPTGWIDGRGPVSVPGALIECVWSASDAPAPRAARLDYESYMAQFTASKPSLRDVLSTILSTQSAIANNRGEDGLGPAVLRSRRQLKGRRLVEVLETVAVELRKAQVDDLDSLRLLGEFGPEQIEEAFVTPLGLATTREFHRFALLTGVHFETGDARAIRRALIADVVPASALPDDDTLAVAVSDAAEILGVRRGEVDHRLAITHLGGTLDRFRSGG